MDITLIHTSILTHRVRITDHADEEAVNDRLKIDEIFFSALHGEVIEDYPKDKPFPSCLIFGTTPSGDPLHSVWAHNKINGWSALVTVYRPDKELWINYKIRRKES